MKKPTIQTVWNFERHRNIALFSLLFLATVLIRLPYFFPSVIAWDESTFILMGQSILDGYLPYTQLWDQKAPLAFLPFALFIAVFGDGVIGIRIGGALFVLAAAYLTYRIGHSIWDRRTGLLAAIISIVFISFSEGGQSTMTEILACVPGLGALAVALRGIANPRSAFLIGFLLSLAILVRLNLAYLALAVGALVFAQSLVQHHGMKPFLMYTLGGFIPVGIIFALYFTSGHLAILIQSLIEAPLEYSTSQFSMMEALGAHLEYVFQSWSALLWIGFLGGVAVSSVAWRNYQEPKKLKLVVIATFFFGIALSIIRSGAAWPHYLIQLIPLMSLLAGYFYASLLSIRHKGFGILILTLILAGLIPPAKPLFYEYLRLGRKLANHQPLMSDTGYKLAEYLRNENPQREPMYLMNYHIAHWLTGTKPLSKLITHPSNIAKPSLLKVVAGPDASTAGEIEKLFLKQPLFVVKAEEVKYLRNKPEANAVVDEKLRLHYTLVQIVDRRAYVYKRNPSSPRQGLQRPQQPALSEVHQDERRR